MRIEVPVAADIEGIDLTTRTARKKLQNAFRIMTDKLNDEKNLHTNNFEPINRESVFLVNVYAKKEELWTARVMITFTTGGERNGWDKNIIEKELLCCKTTTFLEKEIKRLFPDAKLLSVIAVEEHSRSKRMQSRCSGVASPSGDPTPISKKDHGSTRGLSPHLCIGLCLIYFVHFQLLHLPAAQLIKLMSIDD